LTAYVDAVQDLLRGKYAAVKQMLPPYLADPGNFVAFRYDDGIIIRVDPNAGDRKTLAVRVNGSIKEHAFQVSEGLIHCTGSPDFAPEKPGVTLKLQVRALTGEVKKELVEMGIACHLALDEPEPLRSPPATPFSAINSESVGV
jgi:hypothetical protein